MTNRAISLMPRRSEDDQFGSVAPAKQEHFNRCNGCRYTFKRKEAIIDMRDFREHKANCPKLQALSRP